MQTTPIDVPEEILNILRRSRLSGQSSTDQVRMALAIHLYMEELISIGKAVELAGLGRVGFEDLLIEMGLSTVRYDRADYEEDLQGIAEVSRRADLA